MASDLDHIAQQLHGLAVDIDSLVEDPANARVHDERNIEAVKASLQRFGQRFPIVVQQKNNVVRAGNARLRAARELGWERIAALVVDESDLEATAFAIADNRTAELAGWDDDTLHSLLSSMDSEGFNIEEAGFTQDEMLSLIDKREDIKDTIVEPNEVPVSRDGDLWVLGNHRILCGDSTDRVCVDRVMGGEKAALVATDPPYGVSYTGTERPNPSGAERERFKIDVDAEDSPELLEKVIPNICAVMDEHCAVYIWHGEKQFFDLAEITDRNGLLNHQWVVWYKPSFTLGYSCWARRHEKCSMFWARGSKPNFAGPDWSHEDENVDDVWVVDWNGSKRPPTKDVAHLTSKPIELFARPMRRHTARGDICFEPFSGSGTAILAAEQEGRRCFAIDIVPNFVDMSIGRWQAATGEVATLDGVPFHEIAKERGVAAQD